MHVASHKNERFIGFFLVAGAAMLFASTGLFGKALYARGVGFELLVTVRAVLAMPLFAWFAADSTFTPLIAAADLPLRAGAWNGSAARAAPNR